MGLNTERFDLSKKLIHFFRLVDQESKNSVILPEDFGFANVSEDTKLSALFLLRCAIRFDRLLATWSIRGGKRTIYGESPVVCFSEMPIGAFLESSTSREQLGQAMSPYAIVFPKGELYTGGARPVIYGLDAQTPALPKAMTGLRVLPEATLPKREQFRYVTYSPVGQHQVDWTHEREWRWPFRQSIERYEEMLEQDGIPGDFHEMPAMEFAAFEFNGLGVIVKSSSEAMRVANDVLTLIDRGDIAASQYSFVLALDSIKDFTDLRDPKAVRAKISGSVLNIHDYFLPDSTSNATCDRFWHLTRQIEEAAGPSEYGAPGCCWVWLLDPTHRLTHALLSAGDVTVSKDGRYLVKPHPFRDDRGWDQREKMVKDLCSLIRAEFEVECSYFFVLNSDNPDGVPFYCDDMLHNNLFYNISNTT